MNKKKIYVGLIAFASLFIISIGTLTYDYHLALKEERPNFAKRTAIYKDGGTTVYIGFGYEIIDYNELNGRDDIQFKSLFFNKSIKDKSFNKNSYTRN